MPSDASVAPVQQLPHFDPPVQRRVVRITNLFGTSWEPIAHLDGAHPLTEFLRFGRLATYYQQAADQLPTVAGREQLDVAELTFNRWTEAERLVAARLWILVMSSGQSVVALTLDIDGSLLDAINPLEDCYYLDVMVESEPLEQFACRLAVGLGVADAGEHGFAPERHQLVFSPELLEDNREEVIQKVVYRADLPYRPEFSAIAYPAELNRRPYASVAVGPYVSVMCGQQDYVENGAFVSAAQAVASAIRLREVRDLAYEDVRLFRDAQANVPSLHTRRHTMEHMAKQLGNLELELSFSVESAGDLGMLVPSLRVAGYHDTLFHCMGLRDKAGVVGRMLERLERSISAEMTAIESAERRADEDRRMRWTVAVGFLSTVALPITLVLTFFGINASEVDDGLSMFSEHYLPMYLILTAIVLLGFTLSGGLYLQQRRRAARDAQRSAEAMSAVRNMTIVRRQPSALNDPATVQTRLTTSGKLVAARSDVAS